MLKFP
jgi:ubiquitin fusion degradation protein 1